MDGFRIEAVSKRRVVNDCPSVNRLLVVGALAERCGQRADSP